MQQVTAESVISCTEVLGPSAARRPRSSMRKSVLRESPQAWAASVIPFSWFFPPMLLASFRDERIIISLKNTGAKAHTVRVAGYADVMIDNNDRAPICATEDGGNTLLMTGAPQNDYAFRLVATTCDTVWYGLWSMRIKECFTDLENRGPGYVYSRDSGLAYSWTATVRPGEEWSRYVLIGTGSEEQMTVEIPQIPVPAPGIPEAEITLNTGEVYLTEGRCPARLEQLYCRAAGDPPHYGPARRQQHPRQQHRSLYGHQQRYGKNGRAYRRRRRTDGGHPLLCPRLCQGRGRHGGLWPPEQGLWPECAQLWRLSGDEQRKECLYH